MYPPRVFAWVHGCTWKACREILPWITTYARYEIRQTYLGDSSQETTRWPDTIKLCPRDEIRPRNGMHIASSTFAWTVTYIALDERWRRLPRYWRIVIDTTFVSMEYRRGERRRHGKTSLLHRLFPCSIDSQKMPVTRRSYICLLPSTFSFLSLPFLPPLFNSTPSLFPSSVRSRRLSLAIHILLCFSFDRDESRREREGERSESGMPPRKNEKCNKKRTTAVLPPCLAVAIE